MRIAAIYDIHGNLPALEAVLQEVERCGAERVVVGGDVLPGPMPAECLDRLAAMKLPAVFILGNGDRETLAMARGAEPGVPKQFRQTIAWCAGQLTKKHQEWIATWPATWSTDGNGEPHVGKSSAGENTALFCHASPRNDIEIFTRLTSEERLRPMLEPARENMIVCGHTHMPFDRVACGKRIVNAGSVGMSFAGPGAFWATLDLSASKPPKVELRRTGYELEGAAALVRAGRYPQREEFAAKNILQPPSEEETLAAWAAFDGR